MIGNILLLFIFVVMSKCTVENQGILFQMSSGENVCNNDKLFRNFKFSDVPEFGAMCNIPVPNETQVEILLENNVTPILCMGVLDVSLRLCNEAINDTSYFKDLFPPSPETFTGIFNTLKRSEEYSDLKKFCSETVKKHTAIDNARPKMPNNAKFWWIMLYNKLNINEDCISICRTNEINHVHPLCSYIVWSNDMVHNHQNSLQESEAKNLDVPLDSLIEKNGARTEITRKIEESLPELLPEVPSDEIDKAVTTGQNTTDVASAGYVIPSLIGGQNNTASASGGYGNLVVNTRPTENVTSNLYPLKQSEEIDPDKRKELIPNKNKEITATEIESNKDTDKKKILNAANENKAIQSTAIGSKVGDNKNKMLIIKNKDKELTSTGIASKSEISNNSKPSATIISENNESKLKNKAEGTKNENVNSPGEAINLNSAGNADGVPEQFETDVKNKEITKPIEIVENDQNDFNGEINLDSIPSDQPIGNEPETQQQFEEELDDVDDEATVGESPGKATLKKTGDNFSKHDVQKEQGKPDEVYSEVDRTVLLEDPFVEAEDTHFFSYFLFMSLLTITAYLAFHNKNKLLALAVEGRRTKSSRRRPNSSNYSKLDCNLEEAMVSNTTASVTHVLY